MQTVQQAIADEVPSAVAGGGLHAQRKAAWQRAVKAWVAACADGKLSVEDVLSSLLDIAKMPVVKSRADVSNGVRGLFDVTIHYYDADFTLEHTYGMLLYDLYDFREACKHFQRALTLDPSSEKARESAVWCNSNVCDWRRRQTDLRQLRRDVVLRGRKIDRLYGLVRVASDAFRFSCIAIVRAFLLRLSVHRYLSID
jgi:hypothetical protein